MLNEIPPPRSMCGDIGEQPAYYIELVIAGEDLLAPELACLPVLFLDDLGVVLQNVREASRSEDFFPEIIGLEAIGVRRIARPTFQPLLRGRNQEFLPSKRVQ